MPELKTEIRSFVETTLPAMAKVESTPVSALSHGESPQGQVSVLSAPNKAPFKIIDFF